METNGESRTLQTTRTSIEVLKLLEELDGARVSELADQMDRPRSTIHSHLKTLRMEQFAIKEGDIYYPGPELLRLGNHVQTSKESYVLAGKFTDKLYERIKYRSVFVAEMNGRGVFIHTTTGDLSDWTLEAPGNQLYLHSTAVGKAILANKPRRFVETTLDKWGMPQETPNTITNREELFDELESVREKGYAINRGENVEGLYAIGVAAENPTGIVIGGFSVSGPERRFNKEEFVQTIVVDLTEIVEEYELELSLGH